MKLFPFTRWLAALVLGASVAACGGGSSDDSSEEEGSGTGLVGNWTTDIARIMADNPSTFSGVRGSCSGPVNLVFKADGTFNQDLNGTCRFPEGITGTITLRSSGNYAATSEKITITNARNEGAITAGGVSTPISIIENGTANYTIEGNVLTLRPNVSGATVQRYTRS
ncbi:hypothetical protein [Hydrogenophaga sp. 5NK40-0174]|uniref:hypothetical protein n=1 Tax=Hydrogenophaga sp. 5NK40-0174 TaxID=3127649 RepID=UPI0031083912